MKAVLISIQPKWCELIASGKKTVEIRKTKPKLETPFKVYIYCTKAKEHFSIGGGVYATSDTLYRLPTGEIKFGDGFELMGDWSGQYDESNFLNGKVIGEFVCDRIEEIGFSPEMHGQYICKDQSFVEQSCVPFEEMFDYLGEEYGYGWQISDIVIYDKPKELSEFYKCGAPSIDELLDIEELCQYCSDTGYGKYKTYGTPNGPVMCEGRFCDNAYQEYLDEKFCIVRPPQSWCYVEGVTDERPDKN